MIILSDLDIKNYRNVKHAELNNLGDINLFIGPNNCGKTNLLHALLILSRMEGGEYPYLCGHCESIRKQYTDFASIVASLNLEEKYLKKEDVEINFNLNEEVINLFFQGILSRQKGFLSNVERPSSELKLKNAVFLKEQKDARLRTEHLSIFCDNKILNWLKGTILYCPEQRLERYNNTDIREYIRNKKFHGSQLIKLTTFLKETIDSKISDYTHPLDLIREIEDASFETSISEQGSGVRSLICLYADILSEKNKRIILIDEPELGLNPSAKQEFLKLLLEMSKDKQFFLSTHDPTFVNPIIWKNKRVSVYLFSLPENRFLKINLDENKEDPNTFAGYLPHTVSLKDIHIYAEGMFDVYIFQNFLRNYLKKKFIEWWKIYNRVGTYHLGGSFWKHLLYTIPKQPYQSIVILDGDKREEAKKTIEKYNEHRLENLPLLTFCETIEKITDAIEQGFAPIYCLKNDDIEDYLKPKPEKKEEGPKKAEEMEEIPEEIELIFNILLKNGLLTS